MNRNLLLILVALAFGYAPASAQEKEMRTIAGDFSEKLAKLGKKNVAVVDFTDLEGNVTGLGRYLAEQLSVALAITDRGVEVVDRTHLNAIVRENKLSTTGMIDPSTARKLGQITGVEVLITGTLTTLGDTIQLAVKALDAATARILAAAITEVPKTKAVESLNGNAIGGSDTGGTSAPPPSPRVNPLAATLTQEADGIVLALNSCRFSSGSVTCMLRLTSKEGDRQVTLGQTTRIIDQDGRQYDLEANQLGAKSCSHCNVEGTLVSDVPTATTVRFASVAPDISRIALLEITLRVASLGARANGVREYRALGFVPQKKISNTWRNVQFRNIPVTR